VLTWWESETHRPNHRVTLRQEPNGGASMEIRTFPTVETMEQMITMGTQEGISSALG
jgi:hypothetical protein